MMPSILVLFENEKKKKMMCMCIYVQIRLLSYTYDVTDGQEFSQQKVYKEKKK
jgi:hypothetical protein